jgi:hypothetical protein
LRLHAARTILTGELRAALFNMKKLTSKRFFGQGPLSKHFS